MTRPPEVRRDWFKTGVHFICGAVLGALVGGLIVARLGGRPGWLMLLLVLVHSLVVGALAGTYLDDFWGSLRDSHTKIRWPR